MASPALPPLEPKLFYTLYPPGTIVETVYGDMAEITSGLGRDGKVQVRVGNLFQSMMSQLLCPIIRKGMWVLVPSTNPGEKYIHARVIEDDQFHPNEVVVSVPGEGRKTVSICGLQSIIPIRKAPSFAPIHAALDCLEREAGPASRPTVSSMPRQSPSTPQTAPTPQRVTPERPSSGEAPTPQWIDLTEEFERPSPEEAREVIDLTEECEAGPASPPEQEEAAPTPYTVVDETGKARTFYRYRNGDIGFPSFNFDVEYEAFRSKITYAEDGSIIYRGFDEESLPEPRAPRPAGPARAPSEPEEAAPLSRRRKKSPLPAARAEKERRGGTPVPAGPAEEPSIEKSKPAADAKALLKQRRYQWDLARPKSQGHVAVLNAVFEQSLRLRKIDYIDFRAFEISPEDGLPTQFACEQIPGLSVMNWGVFLKPSFAAIPENTLVHVYTGEIHVAEVGKIPENTDYNFDMLKPEDIEITREQKRALGFSPDAKLEVYIDGSQNGNFLRFVNHAGKEAANLRAELVKVERTPAGTIATQVAFYTKKRIKPGDQLMLDYDKNYWKSRGLDPVQIRPESHRLSARRPGSQQYRVVCLAKECLCNLGTV